MTSHADLLAAEVRVVNNRVNALRTALERLVRELDSRTFPLIPCEECRHIDCNEARSLYSATEHARDVLANPGQGTT